jgi:hypothetical protein
MLRMKRFLAAIFAALTVAAAVRAQAPAGPPDHVKALLIGLTSDEQIGAGVAADLRLVEGYVRGLPGFDADQDLNNLTGADVTPDNIFKAIDDLDVGPNDVLFCYYAGHGAYDPKLSTNADPSGGHFFQIPGGDLRRADLLNWLQFKGARLTVLLSETCNVEAEYNPPDLNGDDPAAAAPTDAETPPDAVKSPAFQALLFNFTGVVDVSGAARDQYGMAADHGSLSTLGMLQALEEEDKALDSNPLPFLIIAIQPAVEFHVDWDRFLQDASEDVHTLFQQTKDGILAQPEPDDENEKAFREQLRDQDDLRPQTFELDVQPVETNAGNDPFTPPAPSDSNAGSPWGSLTAPGK